jgi:hypothetical protein
VWGCLGNNPFKIYTLALLQWSSTSIVSFLIVHCFWHPHTMANPGQFLVVLIALASVVSADKAVGSQVCVGSCSEALLSIVFAGKGGKACYNSLRVSSIFYCAKIHCRESVLAVGIDWLDNGCATAAPGQFTIAAYESATANATSAFLEQLPTVNLKESDVINNTVVPSADAWYLAYGTLVSLILHS